MILLPETQTRVNDLFITDDSIKCTVPSTKIVHPLITGGANDRASRYQADFYKKIALDIVTETVFDYPYPYISEKTLRPIACKRMFIILGPPHILKLLHSKGFETFDDFIDESYDNITCATERFHQVVKTIQSFFDIPLDDIKNFYKTNQKRFDHNFQILTHLRDQEHSHLERQLANLKS